MPILNVTHTNYSEENSDFIRLARFFMIIGGSPHAYLARYDSVNDTINIHVDNGAVRSASYTGGAPDTSYPLIFGDSINVGIPLDGGWTSKICSLLFPK
jgi:hypothetical protein